MTSRLLCALTVLFALAGTSCGRPLYVEYVEATKRTRPVFKPGDTVIFKTKVRWLTGVSPCEKEEITDEGFVKCKIRKDPPQRQFAYKCTDVQCDPEVAVDSDPGQPLVKNGMGFNAGGTVTLLALSPDYIYVYCDGSTLKADLNNQEAAVGATIAWRTLSENIGDWTVTLPSAALCSQGTTIFTKDTQLCTVQNVAPVTYTITATTGDCTTAGSGMVTPKP